jgi:hypothetical protein
MAPAVLGLPLGLYALLTRGRRRTMREIRAGTRQQDWQFQRRWISRGDPTQFDIRGRTHGGLQWIMTSRGTSLNNRGWSVGLKLRFPMLGGQTDLAIMPREHRAGDVAVLAAKASPEALAKIAKFSGAAAGAVGFLKDAQESPTGMAGFDAAYQVLTTKDLRQPLVDASLARRMLEWPADTIQPHSLLAWRDPFGLNVEARLPGPPNWATVSYLAALAEDFTARVPPATPSLPGGFVDRLAANFLRS